MNIQRATPFNETLAKIIFLIIPTAFVCYFLLWNAHSYFSITPGSEYVTATDALYNGRHGAECYIPFLQVPVPPAFRGAYVPVLGCI